MRPALLLSTLLLLAACGEAPADARGPTERATPVVATPATTHTLVLSSTYTGELVADAADLAPRATGLLLDVSVRIGDRVREGQVLARLDDAALRQQLDEARAQLRVAEAAVRRSRTEAALAEREAARIAPLAERELVTAQEHDAARARADGLDAAVAVTEAQRDEAAARVRRIEQQVSDTRIQAPFDGVVAARAFDPGAIVQPGTPVLRVVRSSPLRVRFRIPEQDLVGVEPGLDLQVSAAVLQGDTATGRLERLSGEVDRTDRSVLAEGILEDPDSRLRPGMFARVRVERAALTDALVVPGIALIERPDPTGALLQGVFVEADGLARWIPVDVLGREGDRIAVEGAVRPGDPVLVLGHEGLQDGATVSVASTRGDG